MIVWPFFDYHVPEDGTKSESEEFKKLESAIDYRTTRYQIAWALSLIAVLMVSMVIALRIVL